MYAAGPRSQSICTHRTEKFLQNCDPLTRTRAAGHARTGAQNFFGAQNSYLIRTHNTRACTRAGARGNQAASSTTLAAAGKANLPILIIVMMPAIVAPMIVVHAWAPTHLKALSFAAVVSMGLLAGLTSRLHFVILTVSRQPEFARQSWLSLVLEFMWTR